MYKTIEEAVEDLNGKYGKQDIESLERRFGKTEIGYVNLDFAKQIRGMSHPNGMLLYFESVGKVDKTAICLDSKLFTFDHDNNKYKLL